MNRLKTPLSTLFVAIYAALLAGCGNSSDGPVLSDEEKIQKATAGREAQMNAQGNTPTGTATPPAAGTPGGR